jgi:hypothetical protein
LLTCHYFASTRKCSGKARERDNAAVPKHTQRLALLFTLFAMEMSERASEHSCILIKSTSRS